MAIQIVKKPYIMVVKKNIKIVALLAKINIKKIYNELEEKCRKNEPCRIKMFEDDENINEIEQNIINEELERSLNKVV